MSQDWLREYKRECLLDEHRSLSSFVEKEIVVTTLIKIAATLACLFLAGQRPLLLLMGGLAVLWCVDVLYAYYGDVYKRRRLQVRAWLESLPAASAADLGTWKTPANPFDGISRNEKVSSLAGTVGSPAVSGVYLVLLLLAAVAGLA